MLAWLSYAAAVLNPTDRGDMGGLAGGLGFSSIVIGVCPYE